MNHSYAHSHFGTFDYPNDEKQAKLTLLLSAVMSIVTVSLIVMAILSTRACAV